MKRIYLILLLLAVTFSENSYSETHSATAAKQPFKLDLNIQGFANDYVKLLGFYGDQQYIADSAFVDAKGHAVMTKDTGLVSGMYFIVFPDMKITQLLVDTEQQFSMTFDKANPVNTMVVSNSLNNELLYKNLKFEGEISPRFEALAQQEKAVEKGSEVARKIEQDREKLVAERKAHIQWFVQNHPDAFFTKFKVAGQNPDLRNPKLPDGSINEPLQTYYFINDYWKGYDFSDVRLLRTPVYNNKLKKYIKDFVSQSADSLIKYSDIVIDLSKANKEVFKFTANWIALQYKEPKVMGQEALYVHLIEKYWTYDQAYWSKDYEIDRLRAQAKMIKTSLIGNIGQNVTGTDEFGKTISLYDIKSPFTVLYIFSYDCENCKKQTPKLMKFYNEWKSKGVDVFSICIDGDKQGWNQYLQKNNMTFHNIFDDMNTTGFRSKYYVDVTPEIYVLDKNHKIIASNVSSEQIPAIIIEHQ